MNSTDCKLQPLGTADDETMIGCENEQISERRKQYQLSPTDPTFGVALSGGGIRSGTLNLGILQGLAGAGLLHKVDYLSTVSGGGYIGTWLHSLIRNSGRGRIGEEVLKHMGRPESGKHGEAVKDPIEFLRKYSSYLAPEIALLSADFWSIFVIWFRNVMVNQLMIIPMLAVITAVTMNIGIWRSVIAQNGGNAPLGLAASAILLLVASILAATGAGRVARGDSKPSWIDSNFDATFCSGLVVIASFLIACSSSTIVAYPPLFFVSSLVLWLFFGVLQGRGGFVGCYRRRHPRRSRVLAGFLVVLFALLSGVAASALLCGAVHWIATWDRAEAGTSHVVAWGVPLLIAVWLVATALHVGLMGGDYPDHAREWLARLGAVLSIAGAIWAASFALSVFGPWWLALFALAYGKSAATAVSAWIAASAGGVLAGKSARSSGDPSDKKSSAALEWIVEFAPTVFVAGFLLLISFGVFAGIRAIWGVHCGDACAPVSEAASSAQKLTVQVASGTSGGMSVQAAYERAAGTPSWLKWLEPLVKDYWCVYGVGPIPHDNDARCRIHPKAWQWALALLFLPLAVVGVLGTRIDINEFSMNHFYKNRLVRCYLGATRGEARRPSRFTGFDPTDDFPLASLLAKPSGVGETSEKDEPYYGPYPILNGTVNLFRGSDLARQQRKGESFIFTPLFCGFTPPHSAEDEESTGAQLSRNGYRPTLDYGYVRRGPDIGACTAISGAAANPNWGYHTSASVAFLLTIFDVRLGWWVGNPRRVAVSERPGPRFSPWPLLSELFAQTNPRASYLNISDGGHFENLGLYELVRRRCDFIIVGDGEQDNDLTFESLGGAIRKCRADFGVDIKIDPRRIQRSGPGQFSKTHCVVGSIHYPEAKNGRVPKKVGKLLYLKASLTGDEPEDVAQYQAVHTDFPHEPTPNQFFTESQFESYRKLGRHIFETAVEGIDLNQSTRAVFDGLNEKWYPSTEVAHSLGTRHNEAYSVLMGRLAADPDLSYIDEQIIPFGSGQRAPQVESRVPESIQRKAFFFCLDLIQLTHFPQTDVVVR